MTKSIPAYNFIAKANLLPAIAYHYHHPADFFYNLHMLSKNRNLNANCQHIYMYNLLLEWHFVAKTSKSP